MKKKIIVIGSGFGGLSAACRLAARGNDVEVFEKRDKPGGRGYVYEINGFKFDGGPTMITAPFMFNDIFKAAGRRREDYIEFLPLSPFYRIINHDGRQFDYDSDINFVYNQIDFWNPPDKTGYQKFFESTRAIFEKSFIELADKPFLHFTDLLKVIPNLIRFQSYKSVYQYVSQFIKDDFLRQAFSFHPLLIGGSPFSSPSIYSMIQYLMREWGVWHARGGTGAIIEALVRLLTELGGEIHYNTEVSEILAEGRKVNGIRLADGSVHRADVVISNSDAASTYVTLINPKKRRHNSDFRYRHLKYSLSLFVIYFGVKRRYLNMPLTHHNMILSKRYKGLLGDLFNRKQLPEDFSLYLRMPTITDPSVAPEGCESFCVFSPVPNLDAEIDWNEMARPYRDRIMAFLEENYLPDLRANIVAEHYIDPLHFGKSLNSYKGSAFSLQPVLTQSAWFRPHNRSEDFDNLYLVGAGTHPGAGIAGALSSAIIAENLIEGK